MTGDEEAFVKIRTRRKEIMEPYMKSIEIPLKPYVKEALEKLRKAGIKLAIATATNEELTAEYLGRAGLREYFDEIICAVMVKTGKPGLIYIFMPAKDSVLNREMPLLWRMRRMVLFPQVRQAAGL